MEARIAERKESKIPDVNFVVDEDFDVAALFAELPELNNDQTPEARGVLCDRQSTSPPPRRVLQMDNAAGSPRSPHGLPFEVKITAFVNTVRDACNAFFSS